MSVVNQAEIIETAWLRRASVRLESVLGHAVDAVRDAITAIMGEVVSFREAIREVTTSQGMRLQDCNGTAGIYERLLELTKQLIASLTQLYAFVIQNLS